MITDFLKAGTIGNVDYGSAVDTEVLKLVPAIRDDCNFVIAMVDLKFNSREDASDYMLQYVNVLRMRIGL